MSQNFDKNNRTSVFGMLRIDFDRKRFTIVRPAHVVAERIFLLNKNESRKRIFKVSGS